MRSPRLCNGGAGEWLVLDGRNRIRACAMVGIEAEWTVYDGTDPAGFVISSNLHRRQLTESQRAMIAAKLETLKHGQRQDISGDMSVSRADAAKRLGVSVPSVSRAAKVLKSGFEPLIKAVEDGA
jgi:hypothetical protein